MYKFLFFSLIISLLALNGCARHAQIIIDPNGVDMGQYQSDLAECQQLANQVNSKVKEGIIAGAIVGAVVGEIIGGHHGHHNRTARTAKLGALSGGLQGGADTMHERERVLRNCLYNRGYQILN